MPNSEHKSEDLLRSSRRNHFRQLRAALWSVLGVVTFSSGQWSVGVIFALLLLNELAMLRWGAKARIVRAGIELGGVALASFVVGVVLLVRRSIFLGTLCVVAAVCIALVIGSVGAALRRRGLFRHTDETAS